MSARPLVHRGLWGGITGCTVLVVAACASSPVASPTSLPIATTTEVSIDEQPGQTVQATTMSAARAKTGFFVSGWI